MKTQATNKTSKRTRTANKTFYNFHNNDFLKTNTYLNDKPSQIDGEPEQLPIDDEALLKLHKNNQGISDSINAIKFPERSNVVVHPRNFSTPLLSPTGHSKGKIFNQKLDIFDDLISAQTQMPRKSRELTLNTITHQPDSAQFIYDMSAPSSLAVSPKTSAGPRKLVIATSQTSSPKSIFAMTPQEVQSLEKQVVAKNKLNMDRNMTLSRIGSRKEHKHDVSYIFEKVRSPSQLSPATKLIEGFSATHQEESKFEVERPMNTSPELPKVDSARSLDLERNVFLVNPLHKKSIFHSNSKGSTRVQTTIGEKRASSSGTSLFNQKSHGESVNSSKPFMSFSQKTMKNSEFRASFIQDKPRDSISQSIILPNHIDSPRRKLSTENSLLLKSSQSPRVKNFRYEISVNKSDENEELLNDLKKTLPNIITGAPASRHDVKILSDWVEAKIFDVSQSTNIKEEEKNVLSDQIYSICINEIIRQISVDCAERGELLYHTWMQHTKNFAQTKSLIEMENQRIKLHYQEENQKQYEWYQTLISKRDQEIESCKQEIEKVLGGDIDLNKKMEQLNVKNTKYKQRIDQLKGISNKLKHEAEELREDNRRYAKRLAFKIANTNKGTYVPTFLAHNAGVTNENAREASIPQNLGVGSSVKSPKGQMSQKPTKISFDISPGGGTEVEFDTQKDVSDTSKSSESSNDFAYEDGETNSKQVFRIDHLNNHVVTYKKTMILDEGQSEHQTMMHIAVQTDAKETQTNLTLATTKYDEVLENQKLLDELLFEMKLKKEIDLLAENNAFSSMGDISKIMENVDMKESKGLKKNFSLHSLANKSLIEDRMDGMFKIYNTDSELDAKKVLESLDANLKRLGSAIGSESNRSKNDDYDKTMREAIEQELSERIQRDKQNMLEHHVVFFDEDKKSPRGRHTPRVKPNSYHRFDTIEEQEGNEDRGLFNPDQDPNAIREDEAEDEPDTAMLKDVVEKEPKDAAQDANASYGTEELCNSLNNVEDDFEEAVEKVDKHSEKVHEENEIMQRLKLQSKNTLDDGIHESINSLETPKRAPSISKIAHLKATAHQLASIAHFRKDDGGVADKAKLITVLRMYRVEKEKNKSLQNGMTELEEQLFQEKHNQTKLQGNIEDMNVHIKMLEKLKTECRHERCPLCREEKDKGDSDPNREPSSANGPRSSRHSIRQSIRQSLQKQSVVHENNDEDDLQGEEGVDLDDEIEEEEEDNDEDSNDDDDEEIDLDEVRDGVMDQIPNASVKVSRNKNQTSEGTKEAKALKKKKLTVGLRPELGKKKEKAKDTSNSAALAILSKIKDKKMAKFKNFMPMKMVLKQIHTLYNERINQAKENSGLKEEEFFVFIYKYFLNNFGFRKIAEQKFIILILSVKKYMHIVRINLFARFMSLSQGSSNFNVDEFNKYLEGLDFITNSTMGIPVVTSETDIKLYTPFLRALEFLRYFSENKIPTDEYVEFKREFDSIKESDPKNINRNGIVDFDLFMTKVLLKYRIICSRTKQFVVNAFKAADLDGNKYCSLKEFIMIYRNIERDKFDSGFAENLFYEHADIKVEGEINLSFDKFTVVCVEYGLFSDVQQDRFLDITNAGQVEEKMQSIKNGWPTYHLDIDTKLSKAIKASEEEKEYWISILKILNERITDFQKIDVADYKPLIIAYKILEQEVASLSDNEMEMDDYGVKKTQT